MFSKHSDTENTIKALAKCGFNFSTIDDGLWNQLSSVLCGKDFDLSNAILINVSDAKLKEIFKDQMVLKGFSNLGALAKLYDYYAYAKNFVQSGDFACLPPEDIELVANIAGKRYITPLLEKHQLPAQSTLTSLKNELQKAIQDTDFPSVVPSLSRLAIGALLKHTEDEVTIAPDPAHGSLVDNMGDVDAE
jgi:hypothetical protein